MHQEGPTQEDFLRLIVLAFPSMLCLEILSLRILIQYRNPQGAGSMAYERTLKMLSNGLENTTSDCETLFHLLNVRAQLKKSPVEFHPTALRLPAPPFPPGRQSAAAAVCDTRAIVQDYASVLRYFKLPPAQVSKADPAVYGEAGLLELITDWQRLRAGAIKMIVIEYGGKVVGPPPPPYPGPASENRLWAEIAARLEKLARDADSFLTVQGLAPGQIPSRPDPLPPLVDSLVELESLFHQATVDALQIVGVLAYHLYHAAHQ